MKIYKTVILLKLSFWKTTNVSIFYLIKKWKVKMITWWLFLMASNCNSARNNIENWKKLVNYILLGFFFFFFAKLLVHPLPFLRHQLYTCWFFLIIIIFINEFSCKNLTNFIRKLKEKKNFVWVILSMLNFSISCTNLMLHKWDSIRSTNKVSCR